MMLDAIYALALADIDDLPAHDAAEAVHLRWLSRRFGRRVVWLELLAFRAGLEERQWRQPWWAWWRRLRQPRHPTRQSLIAAFVGTWSGRYLLRCIGGSMTELAKLLSGPDPFYGYDGRHPPEARQTRRERAVQRIARGGPVPQWLKAEAVVTYAKWKLSGSPVLEFGFVPEAVVYLSPSHAAAINAVSPSAASEFIGRLTDLRRADAGVRRVMHELDFIGTRAIARWPGIERRGPEAPRGLWPEHETDDGSPGAPVVLRLVPPGFTP